MRPIIPRNLKDASTARVFVIFTISFSLVGLTGPLVGLSQLPSLALSAVHGNVDGFAGIGQWYPAGAQERTLSISEGDGNPATQVGWLLTGQVDAEDWPLTAAQQGS